MKIYLKHTTFQNAVFSVPEFNFGQLQRWKGVTQFTYVLKIDKTDFKNKIADFFADFRENEINENDHFNLVELKAYQKAGRPTLQSLLETNIELLAQLIKYHQYQILHIIVNEPIIYNNFYTIQSMDSVCFIDDIIKIEGVCFQIKRE